MAKCYVYELIRENAVTGEQGKRSKLYCCFDKPLNVGGLYCGLGSGYPGFQRVLRLVKTEECDE